MFESSKLDIVQDERHLPASIFSIGSNVLLEVIPLFSGCIHISLLQLLGRNSFDVRDFAS